jgi:hypothetical protein
MFGICLEYVWNMLGICLEFVWNMLGICLEIVWNMLGICLEIVWNMLGICLEYVWNMLGICLEIVWNMLGICLAMFGIRFVGMIQGAGPQDGCSHYRIKGARRFQACPSLYKINPGHVVGQHIAVGN